MADETDELEKGRGRRASTPSRIPAKGWWDIALRVWDSVQTDRVMLVAGGVTFYLLLALFPALTAFVSAYGYFADPAVVARQFAALDDVVPAGGLDIIRDRLDSLVAQERGALGFGIAAGLLVAFWSANNGVKALFEALNIAYGEEEKRSFLKLNLVTFAFTIGTMVAAALLVTVVAVVPLLLALLRLAGFSELLISVLRWPVLIVLASVGIAMLYRFGPSRERAKWRWITWGSAFASIVWMAASWGFSYYLQRFADYEAVYGSLGAIIGFMTWTWLSVMIVILGAKINAEMEHQTAVDSTTGPPRPMGRRGAVVADTLGEPAGGAGGEGPTR